jgi:hypothetical protein
MVRHATIVQDEPETHADASAKVKGTLHSQRRNLLASPPFEEAVFRNNETEVVRGPGITAAMPKDGPRWVLISGQLSDQLQDWTCSLPSAMTP